MTTQRPAGLREALELLDALDRQTQGGNMAYVQGHQVAFLRAALAATGDSEGPGLDVELRRLRDTSPDPNTRSAANYLLAGIEAAPAALAATEPGLDVERLRLAMQEWYGHQGDGDHPRVWVDEDVAGIAALYAALAATEPGLDVERLAHLLRQMYRGPVERVRGGTTTVADWESDARYLAARLRENQETDHDR